MPRRTKYQRLGEIRKKSSTYAEKKLETCLINFKDSFFRNKFEREWVFKKMRLDFFFHEVRLGIEVDGPYHESEKQGAIDKKKESECKKNDIFLMRFKNSEIYGDVNRVVEEIYNKYIDIIDK